MHWFEPALERKTRAISKMPVVGGPTPAISTPLASGSLTEQDVTQSGANSSLVQSSNCQPDTSSSTKNALVPARFMRRGRPVEMLG
jgi:hypothetical protein